jgi:hypothetical protein
MIVGRGANGNVFGYNFSTERGIDPTYGAPQPDISAHGNFVFMNLFEGNVVEDADLPDYYHPAGPRNTLFRNGILNRGEAVELGSDAQNAIGNDTPNGDVTIAPGICGTRAHGNCKGELVQWEPAASRLLPPSFYRPVRPSFFPETDLATVWPAFGPDQENGQKIPAQIRFETGAFMPAT